MKVILAFAFFIAGISAISIPQHITSFFSDERLVSGQIENAIEDASQAIKDAGLDPFLIEKETSGFELPVPVLFNYQTIIEYLLSTGLSNIKTHKVSYSVITSRVNFDIELPLIHFSVATAKADGEIFSHKLNFNASGKIDVLSVRVKGVVRVNVGIISGISIRSISIDFTLGDINSDTKVGVMGEDVSDDVNDFFGDFVPKTIKDHYKEINELLEILLLEIIEANL